MLFFSALGSAAQVVPLAVRYVTHIVVYFRTYIAYLAGRGVHESLDDADFGRN
jgi:hypothetical protein